MNTQRPFSMQMFLIHLLADTAKRSKLHRTALFTVNHEGKTESEKYLWMPCMVTIPDGNDTKKYVRDVGLRNIYNVCQVLELLVDEWEKRLEYLVNLSFRWRKV